VSLLKAQQLMASQLWSHIAYLIQTYNILVLCSFILKMKNVAALVFLIRFNDDFL